MSIDILHRSLSGDPCRKPPVVLIGAKDADDDDWWTSILPQISGKLPTGFTVELGYVSNLLIASDEAQPEPDCVITPEAYEDRVWIGASCGRTEFSHGSGTLGARMKLRHDGKDGFYAITNHHVVCRSDNTDAAFTEGTNPGSLPHSLMPTSKACNGRQSLRPDHDLVTTEQLSILSPSNEDHEALRTLLGFYIQRYAVQMTPSLEAKAVFDPDAKEHWNTLGADETKARQALDRINHFNRHFGFVWASSGMRVTEIPDYNTLVR
jgi:hypothetical protein